MIRLLKRFADWLDKRFPEKVVVKASMYDALREQIYRCDRGNKLNGEMIGTLCSRIDSIEKTLAALKDAMVKGGALAPRSESDKMRDAFVRGEFGRLPTRAELEAAAK